MTQSPFVSSRAPSAGTTTFVITALAALVLSCLMIAGRSDFLLEDSVSGHGQAWVTLLLVGFGLSATFGVIYWAVPCVLGVPLFCNRSVFLHYALHLGGLLTALAGTFVTAMSDARIAGILLACGGVIFIVNVSLALRRLKVSDPAAAFLSAMMVFLASAFILGVPFAKRPLLFIFTDANWSVGWIVLVTVGVFFNALLGLSLRVTPVVVGDYEPQTFRAWPAFLILNVGAAWTFAATTFGPLNFMLACSSIFLVGTLLYLGNFWGLLQRRQITKLSAETKVLIGALWMVAGSAVVFIYNIWHRLGIPVPEPSSEATEPLVVAKVAVLKILPLDWTVGLFAMFAAVIPGLVALILQLQKLQAPSQESAFNMRSRVADNILLAAFINYAVGAAFVIVGVWGSEAKMLSLGTIFLVVGAAGLLGSFLYKRKLTRATVRAVTT